MKVAGMAWLCLGVVDDLHRDRLPRFALLREVNVTSLMLTVREVTDGSPLPRLVPTRTHKMMYKHRVGSVEVSGDNDIIPR
jgi:hypothetical protein